MARQIFVNLAVKDLVRTMEFFNALDFTFNPQYTNKNAACLVLDKNILAMVVRWGEKLR